MDPMNHETSERDRRTHSTKLRLPFNDEWLVFWGGDTEQLNHHHNSTAQRYAFDFVQVDENGKFYASDGADNTTIIHLEKTCLHRVTAQSLKRPTACETI